MSAAGRERWMIAAWPGMGSVAVTALVYLLSKLSMRQIDEFEARDLFELEEAVVDAGLVRAARLPRSRLFLAEGAPGGVDLVAFLGEAQPAAGKFALCERLLSKASELGVARVVCLAAWANGFEPVETARVFGAATDAAGLEELRRRGVAPLQHGRITGLNGVLLAAAGDHGLRGTGLLGEMPALAPDLPYPAASAAVLRVFCSLSGLTLDLGDLDRYGARMREQLSGAYQQALKALRDTGPELPEPPPGEKAPRPGEIGADDARRVEELFERAAADRSSAFVLKTELDRLGVFARFEDRFLALFKDAPPSAP